MLDEAAYVGAVAYELALGHGASALVGADVLCVGAAFVVDACIGDLTGEADAVSDDTALYGTA